MIAQNHSRVSLETPPQYFGHLRKKNCKNSVALRPQNQAFVCYKDTPLSTRMQINPFRILGKPKLFFPHSGKQKKKFPHSGNKFIAFPTFWEN